MGQEEMYMKRALELAQKGIGAVNPNPMVGAVLVRNGQIIAEGYHHEFGGPHAEVEALRIAGNLVAGSDLYVNLEPCSHYGKTPPCAKRLIEAGIGRVFVGMEDPNPLVAGKGIQMLRDAGIQVKVGILEEECKELNRKFVHFITTKRPYVLYKAAMSLDGKTATQKGESQWISCEESRQEVMELREEYAAILVGHRTLEIDQPRLTCRTNPQHHPTRILLDPRLEIKEEAPALEANGAKVILVTAEEIKKLPSFLQQKHIQVISLPNQEGGIDLEELMIQLGSRGIDSVLLEGGPRLAGSMLRKGLIQEVRFYLAPILLGGERAQGLFAGEGFFTLKEGAKLETIRVDQCGRDLVVKGRLA